MSSESLLARQMRDWLQILSEVVNTAQTSAPPFDPIARLSPRKRDKQLPPALLNPMEGQARRLLLGLLARRVLALSIQHYDPNQNYPMQFLGQAQIENLNNNRDKAAYQTVAAQIEAVPEADLNGWQLASLQFWEGESGRGQRKRSGSYYTPPDVAAYITSKALDQTEPAKTIVDPACGGGVFLLAALDWLAAHSPDTSPAELITGRIYGLDLNPEAVDLARLALLRRAAELNAGPLPAALLYALIRQLRPGNALVGKFQVSKIVSSSKFQVQSSKIISSSGIVPASPSETLLSNSVVKTPDLKLETSLQQELADLPIFNKGREDGRQLAALSPFDWAGEWPEIFDREGNRENGEGGFGAVLGNPPYLGFNDYSGIEKAYFAHTFPAIYNLKNDLLYYFIARGVEILRPGGRLGYVTSRFWKEAAFAALLRHWLVEQTCLQAIEDFGGLQVFKGAALIDTCLLFLEKGSPPPDHCFEFEFEGRRERVVQARLDPGGWASLRHPPGQEKLVAKIMAQSCLLEEIAICRTGLQTGRDEVFFVDGPTAARLRLEPDILRRAIKSADIRPGEITRRDLFLIYPSANLNLEAYPHLINYLEPHRADLQRRLRYDQSFPYYQLQWPRRAEVFEGLRKLITPYKAPRNTFALDCTGLYFSTDVISVNFKKPPAWLDLNLEQFATNFLNSRLSTFQFRAFSKPVGGGQYDYYANPVKKLAFPRAVFEPQSATHHLLEALARPDLSQVQLDSLVYQLYDLTDSEIGFLERIEGHFHRLIK